MAAYDAIVVGAGPAGSTCAYRLSSAGASVLLLDKARFPRDKPCGGGVTIRALEQLPFGIDPVVEGVVDRFGSLSTLINNAAPTTEVSTIVKPMNQLSTDEWNTILVPTLTGNFLDADEALQFGLVNHVVAHEELIPFARKIAADIINNDQAGVRQIRATYAEVVSTTVDEGWNVEARDARSWQSSSFDKDEVARRRAAIQERGRGQ